MGKRYCSARSRSTTSAGAASTCADASRAAPDDTAQIFEEPFLLTQGGPGEATLSVSMFVYRAGFQRQELGYAAAAGVVMFVIDFVLGRIGTRAFGVGRT
jgi:hypothetical protein